MTEEQSRLKTDKAEFEANICRTQKKDQQLKRSTTHSPASYALASRELTEPQGRLRTTMEETDREACI